MTIELKGKRILFISTSYFGYERMIMRKMTQFGARVTLFRDDPFDIIGLKKVKLKMSLHFIRAIDDWYRSLIIRKTSAASFDYVFVLKGSILTSPFLLKLKSTHPDAVFIQYQWDSLRNYNYEPLLKYFHFNFSFDPADCRNNSDIIYQPLFALDEIFNLRKQRKEKKEDIDLLFVGANHSNRLLVLRNLKRTLAANGIRYKFFVYLPWYIGLNGVLLTRKLQWSELMMRSISKRRLSDLMSRSRFVLDLPSPGQSGITMRVFESLASGCRLITTNDSIRNEPFYDDQHIHVIDASRLKDVPAIIKQPDRTPDYLPFSQYSLSSWITGIFKYAVNYTNEKTAALVPTSSSEA